MCIFFNETLKKFNFFLYVLITSGYRPPLNKYISFCRVNIMVLNGDYIYSGATEDFLRESMIDSCMSALDIVSDITTSRYGWLELVYSATFEHYLAYGLLLLLCRLVYLTVVTVPLIKNASHADRGLLVLSFNYDEFICHK